MLLPGLSSLLAANLAGAVLNPRQTSAPSVSRETFTQPLFNTRVVNGSSSYGSTFPIQCNLGCWEVAGPYYFCFINTTLPDGSARNATSCDNLFCSQGNYTQLLDCANCLVANGGERPFGYPTNESLTLTGPITQGQSPGPQYVNPYGYINADQLNGWLRNVTQRCSSIGRPVTGASTVTAIPTTTGPYSTRWTSGETPTITPWTGLAQYPTPNQTIVLPISRSVSPSGNGSGSGPVTVATASSSSSRAASQERFTVSAGFGLLGMVLAWLSI